MRYPFLPSRGIGLLPWMNTGPTLPRRPPGDRGLPRLSQTILLPILMKADTGRISPSNDTAAQTVCRAAVYWLQAAWKTGSQGKVNKRFLCAFSFLIAQS